ncbi:MAG: acyl-ACP thioesterase [Candidatus Rokubacteria bacterium]|nr:acyl-ACP thioesterase [Candidatus Rokubacteria bacterium]MBI3826356.1 acyl-ACP thioesterase [Candidatus Rokubacteria bacterium]
MAWLETYRGTVFAWEVDAVEHFTVAYYFDRFEDATILLLAALGLGPEYMAREGRGCVTTECFVRYTRELRKGDVMYVQSGIVAADAQGLTLGHKLFDSADGALCSTVEQRAVHVDLKTCTPIPLAAELRCRADDFRVPWDGPARERRPQPRGVEGFVEAARDTVKAREMSVFGQSALSCYIHRFSAAGANCFSSWGMTPAYMREEHRGMSTFEFQLAIHGPLRTGDRVEVKSGLLHLGNTSIRVFHKMFVEGALVASLDQLGVHLDMDARRPGRIPEALRAKAVIAPTDPA